MDRSKYAPASGVARGGYVLADAAGGKPELILIGTGSELSRGGEGLRKAHVRGDQGPGGEPAELELFEAQPASYRESVLPDDVTVRVAVEAGVRFGWDR